MNVYDSNRLKNLFEPKGYIETDDLKEADLIVLNTCHIREKVAEKVYSDIGRIKKIKKNNSLWSGECYVFDNRVSLKHGLLPGTFSMCSGCRKPISLIDKKSNKYEEGVSCPNCHDSLTISQKDRFRMRQKQIILAKKSGKKHIFQKEYN